MKDVEIPLPGFPVDPFMIYECNTVKRYHTIYTTRAQNTGEHCANMMGLLFCTGYEFSRELVFAIMTHDYPEMWTGDMPAHAKMYHSSIKRGFDQMEEEWYMSHGIALPVLSAEDQWMLKWLDVAELCAFCQTELKRGNQDVLPCYTRGSVWLASLLDDRSMLKLPDYVRDRIDDMSDRILGEGDVCESETSRG